MDGRAKTILCMADAPKPESKPKSKPESDEAYDPLVLDKTFPQPERILKTVHPSTKEIASDCLFVLDANTLLAPFAVGKDSLADVDRVFRSLVKEQRLYVPAQAVREYARHRSRKVAEVYEHLKRRMTAIDNLEIGFQTPMFEGLPEHTAARDAAKNLSGPIKSYREKLKALIERVEQWNCNDPVSKLYSEIFSDKYIFIHGESENSLRADLEHRILHKLPPGYKDSGKPDGGIGDLIIWRTILNLANQHKRNVIFVSNDAKPDWTVNVLGESLFPRYELIDEFYGVAGKHFAMMTFGEFLSSFNADEKTIEELKTAAIAGLFKVMEADAQEEGASKNIGGLPDDLKTMLRYVEMRLQATLQQPVDPLMGFMNVEDRYVMVRACAQMSGYRKISILPEPTAACITDVVVCLETAIAIERKLRVRMTRELCAEFIRACLRALEVIRHLVN